MNYSVKKLRETLEEKIAGLGIDPKFKENPAFTSVLVEIDNLISEMNMFETAESVTVREEEGKISFDWISNVGERYSMSISSSSPETFSWIRTKENKPFVGTNGQIIRVKEVVEEIATIDKSESITLTTNGSTIDNVDCSVGECNNSTWSEKKIYTSYGVMKVRGYKRFPSGKLIEDFAKARVDSMLYIPRQAFDFGFWYDKYEMSTVLKRKYLDIAEIYVEDRNSGTKYCAETLLNPEQGLKEMVLPGGYDLYPQHVTISPLSEEEIIEMINREKDPKVAKGLKEYAIGRGIYYYDSTQDKNFINEGPNDGILESEGKSK